MSHPQKPHADLLRTVLSVLTIGVLLSGSYIILQPFLAASVWATMIVIATWPVLRWLQLRIFRKRMLTSAVMSLFLLAVLFVPLWAAIGTIAEHASKITSWVQVLASSELPPTPVWVQELPVAGKSVAERWERLRTIERAAALEYITPHVRSVLAWFVSQAGSVGMLFIHFLLTVILSCILYLKGEVFATGVIRFATRLGGERGKAAVILAAQAIRSVALGIVVTALIQSAMAWLGFVTAGVPYPGLLTAAVFMFGVAQIGPVPVLLPTVVWVYWAGGAVWGTAILIWSILVGVLDNLLRPWLIKRGADLPLLLIFAGVIGGLLAFGIIGLFVGPVVLAISYTLLNAWIEEEIPA